MFEFQPINVSIRVITFVGKHPPVPESCTAWKKQRTAISLLRDRKVHAPSAFCINDFFYLQKKGYFIPNNLFFVVFLYIRYPPF